MADLYRKHSGRDGVIYKMASFTNGNTKYGSTNVSEAKRLRCRLKHVAEAADA